MQTKGNYTHKMGALLYLGKTENADVWSSVEEHGKEFEDIYWEQSSGYSR